MKQNKLCGLLLFHMDDFLTSGNDDFFKDIVLNLRKVYKFGKISRNQFVFTGIHLKQNEQKEIFINQYHYVDQMENFKFQSQTLSTILQREENRLVRKSTGQLS